MKKLEGLRNEKFTVSNSELNQIKGGYGPSNGYTTSTYDTALPGGGSSTDYILSDITSD